MSIKEQAELMEKGEICGVCGKTLDGNHPSNFHQVGKGETLTKFRLCGISCEAVLNKFPEGHPDMSAIYAKIYFGKKKRASAGSII